jgi:hypothetical protein
MKLSTRIALQLADIEAAERICRLYEPKDRARDPHYRAAADCWDRLAESYRRFLDDNHHLALAAESHEQEAEAEEPLFA